MNRFDIVISNSAETTTKRGLQNKLISNNAMIIALPIFNFHRNILLLFHFPLACAERSLYNNLYYVAKTYFPEIRTGQSFFFLGSLTLDTGQNCLIY